MYLLACIMNRTSKCRISARKKQIPPSSSFMHIAQHCVKDLDVMQIIHMVSCMMHYVCSRENAIHTESVSASLCVDGVIHKPRFHRLTHDSKNSSPHPVFMALSANLLTTGLSAVIISLQSHFCFVDKELQALVTCETLPSISMRIFASLKSDIVVDSVHLFIKVVMPFVQY